MRWSGALATGSRRSAARAAVCLTLAAAPLAAVVGPWSVNDAGRVRLVSRWSQAPASGDPGLALQFELSPGWHVYWKNAGDAGYPPALAFSGDELHDTTLRFPAPRRFDLPGGLVAFGYADAVTYPIDGRLASDAPNPAVLTADLDYLACASECVPYRAALSLDLPTAAAPAVDTTAAPIVDAARARLPKPIVDLSSMQVDAELLPAEGPELTLELSITDPGLSLESAPELFFEAHPLLTFDRVRFTPAPGGRGGSFVTELRQLDAAKPLPPRLTLAWTATGFHRDGESLALESTLDLARPGSAAAGAPVRWVAFLAALAVLAWLVSRRLRLSAQSPVPFHSEGDS